MYVNENCISDLVIGAREKVAVFNASCISIMINTD